MSPSPDGLHLLVDSTGVKMLGEGDWKTKKHGAEYRRQWRKVLLSIDVERLEIRWIRPHQFNDGLVPAVAKEKLNAVPGMS